MTASRRPSAATVSTTPPTWRRSAGSRGAVRGQCSFFTYPSGKSRSQRLSLILVATLLSSAALHPTSHRTYKKTPDRRDRPGPKLGMVLTLKRGSPPPRCPREAATQSSDGRICIILARSDCIACTPAWRPLDPGITRSASGHVANILRGVAGAQRSPRTAGIRAETSGLRRHQSSPKSSLRGVLSPNLRTSRNQ
jgi:hypothetical protein